MATHLFKARSGENKGKYIPKQNLYTPDGMHKRSKLEKFGCKRYGKQFYCFEQCPFPDCLDMFAGSTQQKMIKELENTVVEE